MWFPFGLDEMCQEPAWLAEVQNGLREKRRGRVATYGIVNLTFENLFPQELFKRRLSWLGFSILPT